MTSASSPVSLGDQAPSVRTKARSLLISGTPPVGIFERARYSQPDHPIQHVRAAHERSDYGYQPTPHAGHGKDGWQAGEQLKQAASTPATGQDLGSDANSLVTVRQPRRDTQQGQGG